MEHEKIIPFEACAEAMRSLRERGEQIVHCHGTFDLLHPGHIKHLAQAKQFGTKLVVSVTSAPFVNKGPGRPVFSDEQRAYQLAHVGIVDYVVVVPKPAAVEIIERVRPHVYCKGAEYAQPKNTTDQRIGEDAAAVEAGGGRVEFIGEALHSSSGLIGSYHDTLEPEIREYLSSFPVDEARAEIDSTLEKISKLRVLVVGDLILDRYTYCRVQGLTTKARVLAVRPERSDDQLGGSLAIARHIASFGCQTSLIALAGTEPWLDEALSRVEGELQLDLLRQDDYETIVKQRYVERQGTRKDLVKFFAVERLQDVPPEAMQRRLLEKLQATLPEVDLVVLCDYGHGMVSAAVQELLCERAPYLALNCQTNSNNYGFNLITKYRRCDLFSLDERELALASGDRQGHYAERLVNLATSLDARLGWLTLGSSGSIVWSPGAAPHSCPALTKRIVDTTGAGDAFFATAALCGKVGASLGLTSLLSNLSGAMASSWPGNTQAVDSEVVVKNARYLLKSAMKRA